MNGSYKLREAKIRDIKKILLNQGTAHYVANSYEEQISCQYYYKQWLHKTLDNYTEHAKIAVASSLNDGVYIVIITVNDANHAGILNKIFSYQGFVICEKLLANSKDNLMEIKGNLLGIQGFYFNLIERYSRAHRYCENMWNCSNYNYCVHIFIGLKIE